ncbi:MAG TPA: DNA alkylation repair protein [Terriglobia bacterium]|nr:DNA alkylation repair protein [Terriglobia bacterium]
MTKAKAASGSTGADLARLRAALRAVADPSRAPAMQAYMKSEMPYYGVPSAELRRVVRPLLRGMDFPGAEAWRNTVLFFWRNAQFREERYAAIELCLARQAAPFQTLEALPMYEELIVTGAWWDFVDTIASHCIGSLLRRFPREMSRHMRAWSRSSDMWKRRTSILCQLKFKKDTDLGLLYDCIEPSLASREFFLRKAIGWALRQHAWTDPGEVLRYVREHNGALSPLSRREALKNLQGQGSVA